MTVSDKEFIEACLKPDATIGSVATQLGVTKSCVQARRWRLKNLGLVLPPLKRAGWGGRRVAKPKLEYGEMVHGLVVGSLLAEPWYSVSHWKESQPQCRCLRLNRIDEEAGLVSRFLYKLDPSGPIVLDNLTWLPLHCYGCQPAMTATLCRFLLDGVPIKEIGWAFNCKQEIIEGRIGEIATAIAKMDYPFLVKEIRYHQLDRTNNELERLRIICLGELDLA